MKMKQFVSAFLAVAMILGCLGWGPASAQQTQTDATQNNVLSSAQTDDLTKDSQILDYVDPEQFYSAEHIARLPGEETLDSYVFLNSDGSKSIYYMGRPVKYIDDNGTIREKDITLVRKNNGYGMRDNDVTLYIPDAAATGVMLSHNDFAVRLTPQGGSGMAQQEENSIVYANYFGWGTFLRYTPMLSGMKEDIILAKYTGQNSFTFLLETNGLYLYQNEGSYYLAESQDSEAAFYLGQIEVYDAIGRPDLGTMTAETLVSGQRYRLTVSVDQAFLTDPETVYPVTIDPTLTVRDSADVTNTLADTPVFSNRPNKNYGDYRYDSIGYVEGYGTAMTAVRLTSLLADTNYSQLTAEQLTNVTFYIKGAGGQYANISAHALTENSTWTELGLTWNTLGAYSTNAYATVVMGGSSWNAFDLTDLAKEWKTGTQNPQCGFVLISDSSTIATSAYGGENPTVDYRPYVVATYTNQITLNQTSADMYAGEELTLTATTIPAGQAVTWESDTPAIASVSENGVVTGHAVGTAKITASLADGTTAECEIEVMAKTISFEDYYDEILQVYVGENISLVPHTEPAGEDATWASLNPEIASVNNGVVTGVDVGVATIKATLSNGAYAVCDVYVLSKEIVLNPISITLYPGDSQTLDAITVPPGETVEWRSEHPNIATVSQDGEVTAMHVGETVIWAEVDENTKAYCVVTVETRQVILTESHIVMAVDEMFDLDAITTPAGLHVSWFTGDSSVAMVNDDGVVFALGLGQTYITASLDDDTTAGCYVEVVERQLFLETDGSMVNEGAILRLRARTVPENRLVVWESSDPSVATVNDNGLVTGIKAGIVTIRAFMPAGPSITHTIYVTVPDGVYYLHFPSETADYYLQAELLKNMSFNRTVLCPKAGSNEPVTTRIAQMWRITYLGEGRYSIRPINNLDMCLYAYNDSTSNYEYVVNYLEEIDTLDSVPIRAQWTITWMNDGYVFLACGDSNRALTTYGGIQANNVSVVVNVYSNTAPYFRWTISLAEVSQGVALYSRETGLPVDTVPQMYIAPEETKHVDGHPLELIVYPDKALAQALMFDIGNAEFAKSNGNGSITGISGGATTIFVHYRFDNINGIVVPLVVTEIPNGTYFLQNKATGSCADIHGQIVDTGSAVCQEELHGGDTQRWKFVHLGDGTYSIFLESPLRKYYLGVSGDSSTNNQSVILRTGTVTSKMKWKIERTNDNGSCKIISHADEAVSSALAVPTSGASNGAALTQTVYTNDSDYRDEWQLYLYRASINLEVVFDNAYGTRIPNAAEQVREQMIILQMKFLSEFGLFINYTVPVQFTSYADQCSYGLGEKCYHTEEHKNIYNVMSHITLPTAPATLKMAFIGQTMYEKVGSGYTADTTAGMTSAEDRLAVVFWEAADNGRMLIIIHEFGHFFDAPDHYGNGSLTTEEINTETGTSLFFEDCIYGENNWDLVDAGYPICAGCKKAILEGILNNSF